MRTPLNEQLVEMVGPQYHPTDYTTECRSLIAMKWRVALPVAALGGLVIATREQTQSRTGWASFVRFCVCSASPVGQK